MKINTQQRRVRRKQTFQSHSVFCLFVEFAKNTWSQLRQKIDIWPLKTLWSSAIFIYVRSRRQVNKLIITTTVPSALKTDLNDTTFQFPSLCSSFRCPSVRFKHILDRQVALSSHLNDNYLALTI